MTIDAPAERTLKRVWPEDVIWCWGLFVLACLPATGWAGEALQVTEAAALAQIDEAARNANRIAAYVTTSHQIREGDVVTLRKQVRNEAGRPHMTRIELSVASGDKVKDTIYIAKPGATWMIYGKAATRIPAAPRFDRDIPCRLVTARSLRSPEPLRYTREANFSYFGMPAVRITVSLGPETIRRLNENPGMLRQLAGSMLGRDGRRQADGEGAGATGQDAAAASAASMTVAEAMFPVAYVYVIHREVPFILSWQAYSFRGRKVYDVSTQEFQVAKELPDSLFTTPKVKAVQDWDLEGPKAGGAIALRAPFRFRGEERVELFFGSPNRCAVALAMLASVIAGWLMSRRKDGMDEGRGAVSDHGSDQTRIEAKMDHEAAPATSTGGITVPRFRRFFRFSREGVARVSLSVVLLALFVLITLTYSRGGYIAMVAGLLLPGVLTHRWRFPLVAVLIFGACVLVAPHGARRVATIAEVESDAAITNRLVLWKGTLVMIADHAGSGVGVEGFRRIHTSWYQPWHLRHLTYGSAVNDYLSLAAYGGLGLLWAWLLVLLGLVFAGVYVAREPAGNLARLALGLVAAIACYLVAALWSTFVIQPWVSGTLGAVVLALATVIVIARAKGARIPPWRVMIWAGGVSTGCVGLVASAGSALARGYDYIPETRSWSRHPDGRIDAVSPRHRAPRGTVLVLCETWHAGFEAREVLRPLAAAGYYAIAMRPSDFDLSGASQCESLLAQMAKQQCVPPYFLVAQGAAGRVASIAEARIPEVAGLVLVGAPPLIPVAGLSAIEPVRAVRRPVLLVHGERDKIVEASESRRLQEVLAGMGVTTAFHVVPTADHGLTGRWSDAVQAMLAFFDPSRAAAPTYGSTVRAEQNPL